MKLQEEIRVFLKKPEKAVVVPMDDRAKAKKASEGTVAPIAAPPLPEEVAATSEALTLDATNVDDFIAKPEVELAANLDDIVAEPEAKAEQATRAVEADDCAVLVQEHDSVVRGGRKLGGSLRHNCKGAAPICTNGEAGTRYIIEAISHVRSVVGNICFLGKMDDDEHSDTVFIKFQHAHEFRFCTLGHPSVLMLVGRPPPKPPPQRYDMEVLDEPLYATFLQVAGVERPYQDELLAYMDFGEMWLMQKMFDEISNRDLFSGNAIIQCYSDNYRSAVHVHKLSPGGWGLADRSIWGKDIEHKIYALILVADCAKRICIHDSSICHSYKLLAKIPFFFCLGEPIVLARYVHELGHANETRTNDDVLIGGTFRQCTQIIQYVLRSTSIQVQTIGVLVLKTFAQKKLTEGSHAKNHSFMLLVRQLLVNVFYGIRNAMEKCSSKEYVTVVDECLKLRCLFHKFAQAKNYQKEVTSPRGLTNGFLFVKELSPTGPC